MFDNHYGVAEIGEDDLLMIIISDGVYMYMYIMVMNTCI